MVKLKRGTKPKCWTKENVKCWTKRWIDKAEKARLAKKKPSDVWSWPEHDKKSINHYARESMVRWQYGKCAFCEGKVVRGGNIEHFRPKVKYKLSAFIWSNLFFACEYCNKAKGEQEHTKCIKPDREDPAKYLQVHSTSYKLEPRHGISADDYQRAINTIELYKLNTPDQVDSRKMYFHERIVPILGEIARVTASFTAGKVDVNLLELHLASLRELAQPEYQYSLMIKSWLEFKEILQNQT